MKKLPDAEFEVMKAVWAHEPPVTTHMVMEKLGEKNWKAPTVMTFLSRLVERGFLRTDKIGKERIYFPLVTKDEYLKFETGNFIRQYHENSFLSLVNTLYGDRQLSDSDLRELMNWLEEKKEKRK